MNPEGEQRQLTQSCPAGGECVPFVWIWSQQGAMLAVVTEGDSPEVTTVDPATGVERAVTSAGERAWRLSWSPDGSRLLYTSKGALHSVDLGSGEKSVIANDVGEVESIAWSPDGNRIAFDSYQGDRDLIEVMDADGSNRTVLVEQGAPQGPGAPAWSPDGTRIAYVTTPGGFTNGGHGFSFEVWVIGVDGSANTRLFQGRCCIEDWKPPVWSPDGNRVAFWDDADGGDWLSTWLAVRADGTGVVEEIPYAEVRGW